MLSDEEDRRKMPKSCFKAGRPVAAIAAEESPGRKEHRTVESTGRRKFTSRVTENNRP